MFVREYMIMGNTEAKICQDQLLSRLKDGDDAAFGMLVNEHWGKIYNRANSLLSNHQDAEEVAQDTFIKARRNITSFRGECSLSTWLYHIATNLAHNKHWYWWRRKRSQSVSLDMQVGDDDSVRFCDILAGEDATPADSVASNEFMDNLPRAIEALPEKYAQVLRMRNELDLSYEDIATQLNISVGTVKSRLSRAREFLREQLCKIS